MTTQEELDQKFRNEEISFTEYMETPVQQAKHIEIKPSKLRGRRMAQRAGQMLMKNMEPQAAENGIVRLQHTDGSIVEFNLNNNPATITVTVKGASATSAPLERSTAENTIKTMLGAGWTRETLEASQPATKPAEASSQAQQAPLADAAGPFVAAPANLKTADNAKNFILAGNAYFTARSVSGTRYTFRVSLPKKDPKEICKWCHHAPCTCEPAWFVSYLSGPENSSDYTYLGMIRGGKFSTTKASNRLINSQVYKAFRWVWEHLSNGQMPPKTELWHEGRCGRCGHLLTVPESIESGIGPVCESKGGF